MSPDARFSVVGVLAVLLLAGCASGADPGKASDGASAPQVPTEPGNGRVRGIVLDDESVPLVGAQVALIDLALQTVTVEGGAFEFSNVPPGTHQLAAAKLGYESLAVQVDVAADAVTEQTLVLPSLAVEEAYYEIHGPLDGFFGCMIGTPVTAGGCFPGAVNNVLFPTQVTSIRFEKTATNWETFVGELRWDQATAASSANLAAFMSYVGRAGSHWWCDSDGPSPNFFRYERTLESVCVTQGTTNPEPEDDEVEEYLIAVDTGFGGLSPDNPPVRLVVQQRFEVAVTVFFGEPGPLGWTAFPDQ